MSSYSKDMNKNLLMWGQLPIDDCQFHWSALYKASRVVMSGHDYKSWAKVSPWPSGGTHQNNTDDIDMIDGSREDQEMKVNCLNFVSRRYSVSMEIDIKKTKTQIWSS